MQMRCLPPALEDVQGNSNRPLILSRTKSRLELLLLCLAQLRHLLFAHVVRALDLVERVVRVLLELLADLVDFLLSAQAFLVLHLVESPLLESGICSLEAALGVAIDFVAAALPEGQGIKRVVDVAGVEGGEFFLAGRAIEAGEVEATSLLDGGLLAGLTGEGGFFFFQKRIFLGLLASSFGLLCCCCRTGWSVSKLGTTLKDEVDMTYALLSSLEPFFHSADSAAAFFWSSAAFFPAAASAFLALPATFFEFSGADFLPAMTVGVRMCL
jgi:hypothetical protein